MPVVQFATNSYKHQSLPISSQRMVNAYAEKEPQDAKNPVAIVNLHGMYSSVVLDGGPIRGMRVMNGNGFVVSGGNLYSITSAGATVLGGTIGGSGPVVMSDDGTHIVIVNGVNGYFWSQALGFGIITDPNFHPSSSVTFFDNVFVYVRDGTNTIFISNNLDPTTYNGLAFATAQVTSAPCLTVVNQQENLLIFCADRIETWYDAGAAIFPFQPVLGSTIERGCAAKLTPIKEDNSVFFLGDDLVFYRLDYGVPRRISTHAIEDAWRNYTTVSDAFTLSYTWEGHKFVVITFPTGNATWVYDISTNLWHERESWDANNNSLGRWRANTVANFGNQIFFGDAFSGNIGGAINTTFTELGNTMRALMVGPALHQDRRRLFHSVFELDMETGTGPAGPGPILTPPTTLFTNPANSTPSSGTATAAVTAGAAAQSGVVVCVAALTSTISTLKDSAGNTYTRAVAQATGNTTEIWFNSNISGAIVSGTTKFTATTSGADQYLVAAAIAVPGGLTVDQVTSAGTSGATTTSMALPAHVAAPELEIGFIGYTGSTATYTESVGFNTILSPSGGQFVVSQAISNTINGPTWAPSWTTSQTYSGCFVAFGSPAGLNPQVMLDWSDDEGRTFVPPQQWTSMGTTGAYRTRVRWTRLGQSRDRRYRVQISDPVPKNIMAAHAFYSVGQIPAAVGE